MKPVYEKKYKDYTIKIFPDYDYPYEWFIESWDSVNIAFFHRRYSYEKGIGKDFSDRSEFIFYREKEDIVFKPLYMYDHSDLAFNTSGWPTPTWDHEQVGWVFLAREQVERIWGAWNDETQGKARHYLMLFVKQLDAYHTEGVYSWAVYDKFDEQFDSCHGFVGWDNKKDMVMQAKLAIDEHLEWYKEFNISFGGG